MRHRLIPSLAVAALAATALACEGRTSGTLITGATNNVRVRLVNGLTSVAGLDLIVDGQVVIDGRRVRECVVVRGAWRGVASAAGALQHHGHDAGGLYPRLESAPAHSA